MRDYYLPNISPFHVVTYQLFTGEYAYLEKETPSKWVKKKPKELPIEQIILYEVIVEFKLKELENLLL